MSMTGTATGKLATRASFVVRASPRQSATSVEVPPISKVMMSRMPAAAQTLSAPTTPPAGPDSMARTGSEAAAAADTDPPFDCITRNAIAGGGQSAAGGGLRDTDDELFKPAVMRFPLNAIRFLLSVSFS